MEKAPNGREHSDLIPGRNAVTEALRAGRPIDSVLIAKGNRTGILAKIAGMCKEKESPLKKRILKSLTP